MDCRKYNAMEPYLQRINQKYISLSPTEEMRNNVILSDVVTIMVEKMQEKDKLFKMLYKNIFFGGSYYDGLKVGSPDEYDIDLLLQFPKKSSEICNISEVEICTSNKPGFVNLYLHKRQGFEKLWEYWRPYLDINKLLSWMEGVIQRALNDLKMKGSWYIFPSTIYENNLYVKVCKQGPAFTMTINGEIDNQIVNLSVDLVPCFKFGSDKWPKNGFKKNPYSSEYDADLSDFFVVPKYPKGIPNYGGRFWRLSFQQQERYLIHNKERLKPALRLLKKMRDTMQSKKISSYFLKTVVLWEADTQDSFFWHQNSLSYIFMHILQKYQECLKNNKITYFWNKKFNLLETVNNLNNTNMSNRLQYIINDINRNIAHNPELILKYILTPDEQTKLFPEIPTESSWCLLL